MKSLKYILSLFFIITINAQEMSTISGFVRDDATGEPISYANVFLSETSIGSATNVDGYFVITYVPPGSYQLLASMIGFEIHKEDVNIAENENIRINIRLRQAVLEGAEVTVTAERQKFEQEIESSKISLNLREINTVPGFIEADVFRTLQMLPGVQSGSDFSSALYVLSLIHI